MSRYQIATQGPVPIAAHRDPGRDAYLAWCADCEPVLRLILLGTEAEIASWTLRKAQARRVVGECGQDLAATARRMGEAPTREDHDRAESMARRIELTRAWALRELGGEPKAILRRLVGGADPEAVLSLLDVRSLPPPSQAAESYARSQVGHRRPRSEEERDADARRAADAWIGEAQPCG